MRNKIFAVSIALVTVFLLGFLPQYVKASRLESELRQIREAYAGADLRDLIGLAYLQANQKNFGLASVTTGQFFNRVREMVGQTQDAARRKALEDLLVPRDRITAELAKGDAAVSGDLQDLFVKTRAATGGAGAQAQRGCGESGPGRSADATFLGDFGMGWNWKGRFGGHRCIWGAVSRPLYGGNEISSNLLHHRGITS
jgi:hypothetical protein